MKLTNAKIKTIRPAAKDQWFSDGGGLYLRVYPTGTRVWVMRERRRGKTLITKLGEYPTTSLRDARHRADRHRTEASHSNILVKDLIDQFQRKVVERTYKQPWQPETYWRVVSKEFGNRKVSDLTRRELVKLIEDYAIRSPRSADRLRSFLSILFGYALELGYVDNSPMVGVSARVAGYTYKPRARVLSDDEIRTVWNWDNPIAAGILKMQLLTGLRWSEASRGTVDGDVLRVGDTKSGNSHWVYLPPMARELLPLPTPCSSHFSAQVRSLGLGFTSHDCRRTFSTRLNNAGVPVHIVERCLNHSLQGVMRVYNHAEYTAERIAAGGKMAQIIDRLLTG